MAAGIALGPTLLGYVAPHVWKAFLPPESLGYLNALSQAGLVVFVFLIGVRVDFGELRALGRATITGGTVGILVPLLTGLALSPYLFHRYGHGDPRVFALFIGTAMSVTAFPVLARILMERNMMGSSLGTVALSCAAASDLLAWILLAIAVSMTAHDRAATQLWQMLTWLIVFGIAIGGVGRFLHRLARRYEPGELPLEILTAFVVLALLSGAVGEWIGVHAIVGAFAAGIATPREFRKPLIDKLESVTLVLLLPLFFALTGIRTNLIFASGGASGSSPAAGSYGDLILILVAATAAKWGGAMLGARAGGMPWREASQLGVLMNARGLVELIVLNAGLESGILPPAVTLVA